MKWHYHLMNSKLSDSIICGYSEVSDLLKSIRRQFLVNRVLLKPPVTFATFVLRVGTGSLVSFNSSSMLGDYCWTGGSQNWQEIPYFAPCWMRLEDNIFSFECIQGCYPHPNFFCPPVSVYVFDHTLLSLCTHSAPWVFFLILSAAVIRRERRHLFPMLLSFLWGMCYHRIHFPTETTLYND